MSPQFAAVSGAQQFQRSASELQAVLETLYEAGADVNEEDEDSEQNVLHQAIDKKQWDILPFLIAKGAYINDKDFNGFTALAKAVVTGHSPTVKLLLQNKANPKVHSEGGITPLATACKKGHLEVARILIEHGSEIDAEAYYASLCQQDEELRKLLRANGGYAGSRNVDGSIALHCAACDNNIEAASSLCEAHKQRNDSPNDSVEATTNESA